MTPEQANTEQRSGLEQLMKDGDIPALRARLQQVAEMGDWCLHNWFVNNPGLATMLITPAVADELSHFLRPDDSSLVIEAASTKRPLREVRRARIFAEFAARR